MAEYDINSDQSENQDNLHVCDKRRVLLITSNEQLRMNSKLRQFFLNLAAVHRSKAVSGN